MTTTPTPTENRYRRHRLGQEIVHVEVAHHPGDINDAITYHDRTSAEGLTAVDLLRRWAKNRFARYIKRDSTNTVDGSIIKGLEYITQEEAALEIDSGVTETVLLGIDSAIARATATLFTQPGQRWEYYTGEDEDEANEEIADMIEDYRLRGGAYTAMQRWDTLSVVAGSAVLGLTWVPGDETISYRVWRPSDVFVGFADRIGIEGDAVSRMPLWSILEDAAVVIVRVGRPNRRQAESAEIAERFLAYFGRSELYPRGRCVLYEARSPWQIPDVFGGGGGLVLDEYMDGEEPANPLTAAQDELGPEMVPHEYPFCLLYGGVGNVDLLHSDTTTYHVAREFDIAASRILKAASDGAAGTVVISSDGTGGEGRMPRSIRGVVSMPRGMQYGEYGYGAAGASLSAWDLLMRQIQMYGETAANIGGFEVTPDQGRAPESGFALSIRAHPKRQYRKQRIVINKGAVARIYEIERSLIAFHSTVEPPPATSYQVWTPGEMAIPRNPQEDYDLAEKLLTRGAISYLEFVRRVNGLETQAQARALLEQIAEQDAAFPPKGSPPGASGNGGTAGSGLAARLAARAGQVTTTGAQAQK